MWRLAAVTVLLCFAPVAVAQDIIAALGPSFGQSLALDGNVLTVGAPAYGQGRGGLWIYSRSHLGWQLVYQMEGSEGDSLGYSLALDDGRLVAGAPGSQSTCWFEEAAGQWGRTQCIQMRRAGFGRSVALAGIFAAVGSPEYDFSRGAADLFVYSSQSGWSHKAGLFGESEHSAFGASLAMDTESLLVGAPLADEPRGRNAGLAYVYERTAGSDWVQQAVLTAGNAGSDQEFGRACALNADGEHSYAVCGAPPAQTSYLFLRSDTAWHQTDVFRPTPAAPNQASGISVDLSQTTAVVGSPSEMPGRPGAIWVLDIDEYHNWYPAHVLQNGPGFGRAVRIDGNYIVVGAPGRAVYGYREIALHTREPPARPLTLSAFPNPFGDQVTIELSGTAEAVQIWNVAGRLVATLKTNGASGVRWRPEKLPAGVYLAGAMGTTVQVVYLPD